MTKSKTKRKKNELSTQQEIDSVIANEIVNSKRMNDEFAESFISYSIMTILERAIPSIDGCKPSQRRTLYDMYVFSFQLRGLAHHPQYHLQGILQHHK